MTSPTNRSSFQAQKQTTPGAQPEGRVARFQAKQVGISRRGFATSYPEQDTPPSYAHKFENIFVNAEGSCEMRPGLASFFETADGVPVDSFHEYVDDSGIRHLFIGSGTNGIIWHTQDEGATLQKA